MPELELDHVKGAVLLDRLRELDPEGFYDVRIKPAGKLSREGAFSLDSAMRGMEEEAGPEYTRADIEEDWRG
jgi:hypothetical protein